MSLEQFLGKSGLQNELWGFRSPGSKAKLLCWCSFAFPSCALYHSGQACLEFCQKEKEEGVARSLSSRDFPIHPVSPQTIPQGYPLSRNFYPPTTSMPNAHRHTHTLASPSSRYITFSRKPPLTLLLTAGGMDVSFQHLSLLPHHCIHHTAWSLSEYLTPPRFCRQFPSIISVPPVSRMAQHREDTFVLVVLAE